MQPSTSPSASASITPDAILAGLSHASREEICNLIALLDATSSLELLTGVINKGRRLYTEDLEESSERLRRTAAELNKSDVDTAGLRHRLWHQLSSSLGVNMRLPLSTRRAK